MGMSRDEALKVWLPIIQMGVETMPECKEAFDMAVDTMRKYQKIQKIINNAKDSDGAVKYNWLYEQISGVMEDGTD